MEDDGGHNLLFKKEHAESFIKFLSRLTQFKETLSRDFRPSVVSVNRLPLATDKHPEIF
jgi:hypothetical protein